LKQELLIAQRIFSTKGIGGLYRGMTANCLASFVSMPIWFVGNELLLDWRATQKKCQRGELSFAEKVAAGAIAGTVSWVPCYPFDKMKAQWQTTTSTEPFRILMGRKLREQGYWRFMYGGFSATLLRSIPQCGMTMAMYDWAVNTL
jgi:solute carrier family 25 carnitine/acylcarnitine transporter 20/29